jgi:hypothetical protein
MAISTTCPHCGKASSMSAELRGKKVRCKSCEETFVVKGRSASDEDSDEDEGPDDRVQTSSRPARKGAPMRGDDDADDRPRRRDDDDERPRRKGKKKAAQQSSSRLPLLVIGGGAAFLLVAAVVVGGIVMFSWKRATPATVSPVAVVPPTPVVQPAPVVQPPPVVPPQPVPATPPARATTPAKPPPPPRPVPPPGPPPPSGWQSYLPKGKQYEVWIPQNGWKAEEAKSTPVGRYLARFSVMSFETKEKLRLVTMLIGLPLKRGEQLERTAVIEAVRDIFLKQLEGTVAADADISLGKTEKHRVHGKEYLIDLKSGERAKLRIYTAGTDSGALTIYRIFQVAVIGSKEQVESDTAKVFLGSFRLPSLDLAEANEKGLLDKAP